LLGNRRCKLAALLPDGKKAGETDGAAQHFEIRDIEEERAGDGVLQVDRIETGGRMTRAVIEAVDGIVQSDRPAIEARRRQ
jgi:hypothetical protein